MLGLGLGSGWAAGGNGNEFRRPLEQGSPGRGKVPSRLMSPGTQVHGLLAAWAAGGNGREFRSPLEQGSPGRGKVPSRPLSPGTQVHGLLAARAAGGDGYRRGAVFGRSTGLKVCLRIYYETQGV